jgi:hypothetical protein
MDTVMKNVAYKTIQNNPNMPNGFIVDHFETDEDKVEGYMVVSAASFTQLLANNVTLLRTHEINKGITGADPAQPAHMARPNEHAEPVDPTLKAQQQAAAEAAAKAQQQKQDENSALFQEFLAWRNAQNSGS